MYLVTILTLKPLVGDPPYEDHLVVIAEERGDCFLLLFGVQSLVLSGSSSVG